MPNMRDHKLRSNELVKVSKTRMEKILRSWENWPRSLFVADHAGFDACGQPSGSAESEPLEEKNLDPNKGKFFCHEYL